MYRAFVALLLLAPTSPCSSDDSSDGTSGDASTTAIDATLSLAALTGAQKQALCDWEAAKLGGYGTTTTCSTGSGVAAPASQTACVAGFNFSANTCSATVGDEYNCVDVIVQSPCQTTLLNAPECQAVISCM